ncbi:MAG: hypothetical protein AM326_07375 [Candidatus Thorarchaeota archaeon SMTZ-45]|nr:MAG: hypothetical protein AM325_12115 [Candidatus Thorarchaeota archaeon SMTZ1-45]KXH76293.1 MAG: hypothetical protein AM326_07375 [Candidatus Thorarchaeota archaeon SMTZ-45]
MSPVKIAAVADVHSPRFLDDFKNALSNCTPPDLLLFAGDMISHGKAEEYINVLDVVDSELGSGFPIIACFGNEDPVEISDEIQFNIKDRLVFLDEELITLSLTDYQITVVGISSVSSELYEAQSKDIAEIRANFEDRSLRVSKLLQDASKASDLVVLLMHFSPLLENISAEFSWWISKAVEKAPPNLIVHGHVHDSIRTKIKIGSTIIRNVALPATHFVTELLF